ncbi:MAG: hypothetical protein OXR66_01040 [Candidatus Woesearchaeota archaeon]|nr:hypothetical protein [Candidatus Woesearchaeota archaeon]
MRIMLIFLTLVLCTAVFALPPPPAVPAPPSFSDVTLSVVADGTVVINVSNVGAAKLYCLLGIDTTILQNLFLALPPLADEVFILEAGATAEFQQDHEQGDYDAEVVCSEDITFADVGEVEYDMVTFTAGCTGAVGSCGTSTPPTACTADTECPGQVCSAAGECVACVLHAHCPANERCIAHECVTIARITILEPGNVSDENVTVSFVHDSATNGTCTARVDNTEQFSEVVNQWTLTTFSYMEVNGSHELNVSCAGTTWLAEKTATFTVQIAPNIVNDTTNTSTNTTGNTTTNVSTNVSTNTSTNVSTNTSTNVTTNVSTNVSTNTSTNTTVNTTTNVSTNVSTNTTAPNTTNVTYNPQLVLNGAAIAGEQFSVTGSGFFQNDVIDVILTGHGVVQRSVAAATAGTFTKQYTNFEADAYYLVARSRIDNLVIATLSFNVTAAPAFTADTLFNNPPPATQDTGGEDPTDREDPPAWVDPVEDQEVTITEPVQQRPRPPAPSRPAPIPTEQATPVEPESGGWGWLIPVFFLVVLGGVLGFLVYAGTVDVSSVDAFRKSVLNMFNGGLPQGTSTEKVPMSPHLPAKPVLAHEVAKISTFIQQERERGFDDLTIRGALIEKGWQKETVDKVFDRVYGKSA